MRIGAKHHVPKGSTALPRMDMRPIAQYPLAALASITSGVLANMLATQAERELSAFSAAHRWTAVMLVAAIAGFAALGVSRWTTWPIGPRRRYIRERFAYEVANRLQGTAEERQRSFYDLYRGRYISAPGWQIRLVEHPWKSERGCWICTGTEAGNNTLIRCTSASDLSDLRAGDEVRVKGYLVSGDEQRISVDSAVVRQVA